MVRHVEVRVPPTIPEHGREPVPGYASLREVGEWALGVLGGIAGVVGAVILLGGDDEYVGLGGTWSWRVGDLAPAWGYGLLSAGVLALAAVVVLVLRGRRAAGVALSRTTAGVSDVVVHAAVFLVVNAFLWAQDLALGGGLDYAFWVTVPWGVGLVAHAAARYAEHRRLTR